MKNILLLLALLCVYSAYAVDGLTIANSHQVSKDDHTSGGCEPKKSCQGLINKVSIQLCECEISLTLNQ